MIHKQNGGVSTARNAGLDAAQGNWIAFVDSDDTVEPEYLEKMHKAVLKQVQILQSAAVSALMRMAKRLQAENIAF